MAQGRKGEGPRNDDGERCDVADGDRGHGAKELRTATVTSNVRPRRRLRTAQHSKAERAHVKNSSEIAPSTIGRERMNRTPPSAEPASNSPLISRSVTRTLTSKKATTDTSVMTPAGEHGDEVAHVRQR